MMKRYTFFDISDIRYNKDLKYHLRIVLKRELFKVRDLIEIEDLVEYFGGECKDGGYLANSTLYAINAECFETLDQAVYFKRTLLMEYE